MKTSVFSVLFCLLTVSLMVENVSAQVIQLPTLRFFNVNTTVSVPDGGTISLGGVNRSASGSISRGVPLLPGPLFNNRGIGSSHGSNQVTASAKIIVLSELEEEVMAEARRRKAVAARTDPNGPVAVQHQADFITRNVGRSKKR